MVILKIMGAMLAIITCYGVIAGIVTKRRQRREEKEVQQREEFVFKRLYRSDTWRINHLRK